MQNNNINDTVSYINENVNLVAFLKYQNYTLIPDLCSEHHLYFVLNSVEKKSLLDIVIVIKHNKHFIYYSLKKKDSGTIIDFVNNRIALKPEESNYITLLSSIKRLQFFSSVHDNIKMSPEEMNAIEALEEMTIKGYKLYFYTIYSNLINMHATYEHPIFELYGILMDTAYQEMFQGQIFTKSKKNGLTDPLCFVFSDFQKRQMGVLEYQMEDYDQDNIGTFEETSFEFSKLDNSFWFSKSLYNTLTLTSHPLEALCHFQLNNDKTSYISLANDQISDQQIEQIYKHIDQTGTKLNLGTPNTLSGHISDLKLLARFIYEHNDIFVINDEIGPLQVALKTKAKDQQKIVYTILQEIQKRNQTLKNKIQAELGLESKNYLPGELFQIDINKQKPQMVKIIVPRKSNQLEWFNKLLLKSHANFTIPVKLDKPADIDWKSQNLKSKGLDTKIDSIFLSSKLKLNND